MPRNDERNDESTRFGALLRHYRLAAGLTQEALAERAAVGARSVQGIEEGERRPRRETLRRLARALGLAGTQQARFEAAAQPAPRRRGIATAAQPQDLARVPMDTGSTSRHNLPLALTSFIGREQDLAEITRRLREAPFGLRLLTLVGAGGCGKTRLALQVARDLLDRYADGVWVVELAPLSDPALVAPTVASTLGVHEEANRPVLATLLDALRSRQMLLILDNCEHLIDACAHLAEAILRTCPEVQILATSREALRIAGEVSWRVPSLTVPAGEALPALDELSQTEAVRLFVERAQAALPGFALTSQNATAVAHICRRLDGIPLTLELAAARLKGLAVEQLAARLDQQFRLLTSGSRTALPRQQTLAALVGWSYDLLSEPERRLFNRLGVFVGGFALEAAEDVCAETPYPTPDTPLDVLDLLLRLVEKSLVVAEPGDEGEDRYRLLETLRQYALEKLAASGEAEAVRGRHGAYYLALAEESTDGSTFGPRIPFWYARTQRELNNVRAALRWAIDAGEVEHALRLCGVLGVFLYQRSWPGESRRWLAELLASPTASQPTVGRGRALVSLGLLAWDQLEPDQADAFLDEALAILRACADQGGIVQALAVKGRVAIVRGNYAETRRLAEEALASAPEGNHRLHALQVLGYAYFYLGDYPAARARFEQTIAARRGVPSPHTAADLTWLGHIATASGDYSAARALYIESMRQRLTVDRKIGVAFTLSGLAGLAAAEGQLARAVLISGAAARLCELSGVPSHRTQEAYIHGRLPGIREALGAAAYDAAWADGRALTQEQAVAYALDAEGSDSALTRSTQS